MCQRVAARSAPAWSVGGPHPDVRSALVVQPDGVAGHCETGVRQRRRVPLGRELAQLVAFLEGLDA